MNWVDAVQGLADGVDIPLDRLEKICDSVNETDKPRCPNCQTSTVRTSSGTGPLVNCVCTSCGKEFTFRTPDGSVGEYSIERLQRDVETLVERRSQAKIAAEMSGLQADKNDLRRQEREALAEREAAIIEWNKKCQSIGDLATAVDNRINLAESAREALERSFARLHPAKASAIDVLVKRRGELVSRQTTINSDLFGNSPQRFISATFIGSTGSHWLGFARTLFGYEGGPIDVKSVDPTVTANLKTAQSLSVGTKTAKRDKLAKDISAYTALWNSKIAPGIAELEKLSPEIEAIEAQITELRQAMYMP